MEQHAQGVDVGPGVGLPEAELLRRGRGRRPQHLGIPAGPGLKPAGDAEVDQVQLPLGGADDVFQLDVPVDDRRVLPVEPPENGADFLADVPNLAGRQRSAFLRIVQQGLAGHIDPQQIGPAIFLKDLEAFGNTGPGQLPEQEVLILQLTLIIGSPLTDDLKPGSPVTQQQRLPPAPVLQ